MKEFGVAPGTLDAEGRATVSPATNDDSDSSDDSDDTPVLRPLQRAMSQPNVRTRKPVDASRGPARSVVVSSPP